MHATFLGKLVEQQEVCVPYRCDMCNILTCMQFSGNILFRDIADFREKNILTNNNKKLTPKKKIPGGFFVPENSKFDF